MLADVVTMGILSLLYFIQAGRSIMGFYFLTSSFVILLGFGSRADLHNFQHSFKPYRYMQPFLASIL